jgi:tripartite ATP-independent transporter DctM subunit
VFEIRSTPGLWLALRAANNPIPTPELEEALLRPGEAERAAAGPVSAVRTFDREEDKDPTSVKTFAHAIARLPYVRRRRGYADPPPTSSSATGLKTGCPCLDPPANPHGGPRVRIRLPPAVSLVRTGPGQPAATTTFGKNVAAASDTGTPAHSGQAVLPQAEALSEIAPLTVVGHSWAMRRSERQNHSVSVLEPSSRAPSLPPIDAPSPARVTLPGVVYTALLGLLVYREFDWRRIYPILNETVSLSGAVMMIIGTATGIAWALTQSGSSLWLVSAMAAVPGGSWGFLAITIVAFIILGSVLEGLPAIVLFGPLLFPVAKSMGVQEALRDGGDSGDGDRPLRSPPFPGTPPDTSVLTDELMVMRAGAEAARGDPPHQRRCGFSCELPFAEQPYPCYFHLRRGFTRFHQCG